MDRVFPPNWSMTILARGGRADGRPGQGIGLAVVVQLVREAHGEGEDRSGPTLGGALVRARLPASVRGVGRGITGASPCPGVAHCVKATLQNL